MYSVPLRRALVTGPTCPTPKGVAAAEVLKVGAGVARRPRRTGAGSPHDLRRRSLARGLRRCSPRRSSFAAGGRRDLQARLRRDDASRRGLSLALYRRRPPGRPRRRHGDAGRPASSAGPGAAADPTPPAARRPATDLAEFVGHACSAQQVRFIGAGTIGVAAIWTLLKLVGPVARRIVARSPPTGRATPRQRQRSTLTERDIPITIVGIVILALR